MSQPAQQVKLISSLRGSAGNLSAEGEGTIEVVFDYMPDNFRMGVQSQFQRIPIPLTSAQLLVYKHTEIQDISVQIKAVTGLKFQQLIRTKAWGLPEIAYKHMSRHIEGASYDMEILSRLLYAMALPEVNNYDNKGIAPPKTVLQVGNLFGGVGVVSGVEIEHTGPWDALGNSTDIQINLTFTPSTFYEPGDNKVGVAVMGEDSPSTVGEASQEFDASSISYSDQALVGRLMNSPSVQSVLKEAGAKPYVIHVGGPNIEQYVRVSRTGVGSFTDDVVRPRTNAEIGKISSELPSGMGEFY